MKVLSTILLSLVLACGCGKSDPHKTHPDSTGNGKGGTKPSPDYVFPEGSEQSPGSAWNFVGISVVGGLTLVYLGVRGRRLTVMN